MVRTLLLVLLSGILLTGCSLVPTAVGPKNSREAVPLNSLVLTHTVGTGTGDLSVDGKAMGILPGELIVIAPGRYSSLTFSNLNGLPTQPIKLVATDLVEVVGGGVSLQNVSFLTMDGGATAKNLFLHDIPYRGIIISGTIPHSLTLQGIRGRNIADYTLLYDNKTTYNQLDFTAFTDFKLLYCDFENCGTIQLNGELKQAADPVNNGFLKNPEVAYCTFSNSPAVGTLLYVGNAENLNIHHNVVDNVNTENKNHNGIFHLKGNGSVHHNKCTNHQGNFVRFWPFSQGILPKDVVIQNNIVWNSRKYSAFELQSFASALIPGVSTYCNARVYNNTVGRMNTTLPTVFVGVVVDVYNLFGGDLQIFNNLSFEQAKSSPNEGIWSQQNVTQPSVYTNNLSFDTVTDAGLVDTGFFRLLPTSAAKAAGTYRLYLIDDFYGAARSLTPSVGAVE